MYTPHPSLVPIEMASAGMLTVTNTFENKTAEAMAADLAEPDRRATRRSTRSPTGCAGAADAVEDFERRVQGSDVRWSRDWSRSFPEALLGRLEHWLELRR